MSVINKMLKDLDEREHDHKSMPAENSARIYQRSNHKVVIFIVIALIILNVCGLYVWQLYSENQLYKNKEQHQLAQKKALFSPTVAEKNIIATPSLNTNTSLAQASTKVSTVNETAYQDINDQQVHVVHYQAPKVVETLAPVRQVATQVIKAKPVSVNYQTEEKLLNNALNHTLNKTITAQEKEITKTDESNKRGSFSVSSRQLTTEELIKQKLTLAEKAISNTEIDKAEKLYQDILFLDSRHQYARTKLAALWYGRKAYQPAVNLLSQGIALSPNNEDFRLMKARIFLVKENPVEALKVLKGLQGKSSSEYNALMANVAQQNGDYKTAISAYNQLLVQEPQSARWWLGLAIAYDSNADFKQARESYYTALTLGNLSKTSSDFVEQRMQVLGE